MAHSKSVLPVQQLQLRANLASSSSTTVKGLASPARTGTIVLANLAEVGPRPSLILCKCKSVLKVTIARPGHHQRLRSHARRELISLILEQRASMSAFLRLQDFTLTFKEQRQSTSLKNALPVITADLALTKQRQILQ